MDDVVRECWILGYRPRRERQQQKSVMIYQQGEKFSLFQIPPSLFYTPTYTFLRLPGAQSHDSSLSRDEIVDSVAPDENDLLRGSIHQDLLKFFFAAAEAHAAEQLRSYSHQ